MDLEHTDENLFLSGPIHQLLLRTGYKTRVGSPGRGGDDLSPDLGPGSSLASAAPSAVQVLEDLALRFSLHLGKMLSWAL